MSVIDEIANERRRQADHEGWTTGHDDGHVLGEMARAAACYALPVAIRGFVLSQSLGSVLTVLWPSTWNDHWWKPKDRRRDLIRAAALIVAEIERIDRATTVTVEAPAHE